MRLFASALALVTVFSLNAIAQHGGPNVAAQKAAMQKLAYLVGEWTGDATARPGPGEPIKLRQTEDVRLKLDGLVLLVEGTGRDSAGKVIFNALATIAFDEKSGKYNIRAYNNGHSLDTELKLHDDGFEWGYDTPYGRVRNRMTLENGAWHEVTDLITKEGREFRSVDLLVKRK